MSVLEQYEPQAVWKYFEEISSIPRGSGNMDAISNYCVAFAKKHQLECIQDAHKNVIIIKEATEGFEEEEPIILQGHLDMVCEKRIDSTFNFLTDSLELETDGESVWAKDTTLGGDDGIAVAYALAILESKDIEHPRLEVVLTVDEEVGLDGAFAIDLSMLKGKQLINLDSEEEGIVWISCAGGMRFEGRLPMAYESREGIACNIAVTGLVGGHSGAEIHLGRANSNALMGRVLFALKKEISYGIAELDCGSKDNAIPRHTTATLVLQKEDIAKFQNMMKCLEAEVKKEYESSEPHIQFLGDIGSQVSLQCLTQESASRLWNTLINFPNGIQAMSMDIPGMVETSLNLGTVTLDQSELVIGVCIRSSKDSAKHYLSDRAIAFIEGMGGSYETSGSYPGWAYKKDSVLRETIVEAYEELHGVKPSVEAIHAGLECGILSDKIEGLDCVSIGPEMSGVHTYEEKLSIKSTKRTWDLLLTVLKKKTK